MSSGSALIQIDVEGETTAIIKKLDTMHSKAPNILRNSLNATARKLRKQVVDDAKKRYAIKDKGILKKEDQGAPKVYTARAGNLTALIKSSGPMQDMMSFMTRPNSATGAAAAQVLNSSPLKSLEAGGLKAFVTTFASGHTAIVQRKPPGKYSSGRQNRASRYGSSADMTKIKKLLSPAVPHMLGNEEIISRAEETGYEILQAEIMKRIAGMNDISSW